MNSLVVGISTGAEYNSALRAPIRAQHLRGESPLRGKGSHAPYLNPTASCGSITPCEVESRRKRTHGPQADERETAGWTGELAE